MGVALKEKPSNIEIEDDGDIKDEIKNNKEDEPLESGFINTGEIRNIAHILNESNLSPDKKHLIMAVVQKKEVYSGPIPHPEHLKQYEELVPGAANRLISMAENENAHRQKEEDKIINAEIINKNRGQIFGFILMLICLIGGFILIAICKNGYGIASIIGSAAVLALAYIYGKKSE